jgi:diguanylate cyclase (GGDEF)-like protein
MTGYSREELLKLGIGDIEAIESTKATERHMATIVETGFDRFESLHRRKDGTVIDVEGSVSFWRATGLFLCFARDITNKKRTEEQIARMARYDSLTGLANRRVFVEALEQAIARAHRGFTSFAILYLDLDHFKDVNDTLGHPVGDVLLIEVAERLRASVREVDTVARFGGDEFAIILNDIGEPANAAAASERILGAIGEPTLIQADVAAVAADVAEKIVRAVTEPIMIQANRIHSGASVGIAVYGPGSSDAETMLSHADVALYQAKVERRGTYRFFNDGMDAELRARVNLSTELRDAIAADQFLLMYQPQVDIFTGRIVGLEALVRWRHPTLGVLGPGKFIPAAERHGLIVPLGRWVMDEACRQTRRWLDAGIALPLIAINLSAIQFKMPLELEKDIAATVAEIGLPPQLLELELTESVLMEASRDHNDVLLRLRKKGHRIAIDDFGSGYSSLDYLRRYPVDRIKIAQTFIADIGIESGNDAIVKAALSLARELNIEVVVEGVETVAQLELLRTWGGRIVQGFYFSRPLPVPEVTALLRIGRITPVRTDGAEVAVFLTAARKD